MDFTGERYMPGTCTGVISNEHWHRYLYVSGIVKGKVIMDIACGEGYGSHLLAKGADRVVGVDISPEAVNHASHRYVKDNLEYRVGSVSKIPFEGTEMFDVLVSFETIEHVTEDLHRDFLNEVKRLLKPDGLLVISTPNKQMCSDLQNYDNEFHLKEFYLDEFKTFLQGYFSNVNLLGQKVFSMSYIWSQDPGAKDFREFVTSQTENSSRLTDEPKGMMYAIALASDGEIPQPDNSILLDITGQYKGKPARHLVKVLRRLLPSFLVRAKKKLIG